MALETNEIKKGVIIIYNNDPYLVLSHEMKKVGRAGANNKTKLKNLISGAVIPVTFSGERVELADVIQKNIQYTYLDGERAVFMDIDTYEQLLVNLEDIPNGTDYLKEGEMYQGTFFNGDIISIVLPKKMSFKVISAPDAVKGDSANNPSKEVEIETGAIVKTPMFVKKGDIIHINTETGEYGGRDN